MPVDNPLYPISEPFGTDADSSFITLPIPIPSQIGIANGRVSFTDGFVPLNMTPPASGGIPPFGKDLNGLLYMITQYCALMQAGQLVEFDATVSAAIGGYARGARLASATVPGVTWTNVLGNNTANPDVDSTNWVSDTPLALVIVPSAGTYHNYVLPGPSDYAVDVDTSAGVVNFGGFVAQRDGQRLIISDHGANLLQLLALAGGSATQNQIRAPSDLTAVQNQTISIQYFAGITKWLIV